MARAFTGLVVPQISKTANLPSIAHGRAQHQMVPEQLRNYVTPASPQGIVRRSAQQLPIHQYLFIITGQIGSADAVGSGPSTNRIRRSKILWYVIVGDGPAGAY